MAAPVDSTRPSPGPHGQLSKGQAEAADHRAALSSLDGTQAILAAAMRGAWQRQMLLTNNVANADTPGYRREDVNFEATLRNAVGGELPLEALQFTPEAQSQVVSPNGGGVSIDQESALLAENGLDYEALSQLLGTHNATLRAAMGLQ